jgi:hypothetical protein
VALKTLIVGRSAFADIVIADESVASHHAEIVVTDDGRLYLTDCGTETGTWRQIGGETREHDGGDQPRWRPMRQGFVRPDEPLRLGEHRCTAGDLVAKARARTGYDGDGSGPRDDGYEGQARRLRGRVERDAATGEIVRRRP